MTGATKLRAVESEPGKEITPIGTCPALGFSMQVDLGAGRVATLQTFLPNDCGLIELNRMLDKMTAAGDRQRAHYQIEGLERDLHKFVKEQEQGELDLQKIEEDFEREQKARQAEIDRLGATLAAYQSAHVEVQTARGARDPNRMRSNDKANADKVEGRIKDLRAEIQVAPEAHATTLREAGKVLENRASLIAKTQAEIDRNREIVANGLKE